MVHVGGDFFFSFYPFFFAIFQLSLNALEGLGLQWEHAPHAVPADRARHFYEGVDDNNGTQPPNHHHQQQPASTTTTSSSLTRAGTGAVGAEAGAVVAAAAATRGTEDDVCEPHTPPISTPKSPENPGDDKADALPTSASDEGAQNGPENGREGDGVTEARCQRDSDFDEILASYLGGDSFGREGGSLLIPLGGLRLLRYGLRRLGTDGEWWRLGADLEGRLTQNQNLLLIRIQTQTHTRIGL